MNLIIKNSKVYSCNSLLTFFHSIQTMEHYKTRENFERALKIIEDCSELVYQGNTSHWVNIAVQLYILLIDRGNKKGPLVEAFHPGIKFHPIFGYRPQEDDSPLTKLREILGPDSVIYPGKLRFRGDKFYTVYLFDQRADPLTREEWLDQPYLSGRITIRKLLTSVRHKEGAHSDTTYDDTLAKTRFFKIAGTPIDVIGIASIGEYVANKIRSL